MNSETGDITTKYADEEEEVGNELVAAVVANAQPGKHYSFIFKLPHCALF